MLAKTLSATRYALLSFRRNPAATFFTIGFPIIFLILFGFIFGGEIDDSGATVATFQVPGILTLSIVSATFINLAMGQVFRREARSTQASSRYTHATARLHRRPGAGLIRDRCSDDSASDCDWPTPVRCHVQLEHRWCLCNQRDRGLMCVLCPRSGCDVDHPQSGCGARDHERNGIPALLRVRCVLQSEDTPTFIQRLGDVFPVKPLTQSLQPSFNPFLESVSIPWSKWAVVAAWGIAGILIAVRRFRWTPQTERR